MGLKVHKIENFFDSDFGICIISLFVSYVKIFRVYQKNFLTGPFLGEVRFFRVVLGLRGMKKNFELGKKKKKILPSIMGPKYDPILVF